MSGALIVNLEDYISRLEIFHLDVSTLKKAPLASMAKRLSVLVQLLYISFIEI